MKGRTDKEGIDPVTDKPAENACRQGKLESRGAGKHGTPQEKTMMEEILDPENLAQAWTARREAHPKSEANPQSPT